jgi:TRAP-type C4-dicarboxylate transport system substrate-binding protein
MRRNISPAIKWGVFLATLVMTVGLLSPTFLEAADKTWSLKVNTLMGQINRYNVDAGGRDLLDRVNKETQGRITYKIFVNSGLAKPPEVPQALQKGIIDAQLTGGLSFFTGIAPEIGFNMVPGVIMDWATAEKVANNAELNQIINKAWGKVNGQMIVHILGSPQYFFLNKKIAGLDAFKGLRIGSSGGMFDRFAMALGSATVTVPSPERYHAMQTGTIDGLTVFIPGLEDYKWGEVGKQIVKPAIVGPMMYGLVIRKSLWDEMPNDIKEGFQRAIKWHWGHMKELLANYCEKEDEPRIIQKYKLDVFEFSAADREKYASKAIEVQEIFAKQSPECKRMIEIYRTQIAPKGTAK